jgi:hypothetical protein
VSWDDVPHLSEEWKNSVIEEYKLADPNSIEARTKGIAAQGLGRIYPIDEEFVVVNSFPIPEHWPRCYGIDFGYIDPTAVIWLAQDPDTKVIYAYAEYAQNKQYEAIHADYIKGRGGSWMWGGADPSGGGTRNDGELRKRYYQRALGLKFIDADNSLIGGIARLLNEMETGQFKIMSHLTGLISDIRMYRWDEKNPNHPARKQNDHRLDAMRYARSIIEDYGISEEEYERSLTDTEDDYFSNVRKDGRDSLTGY